MSCHPTNPASRDPEDVLGASLPDTVSAASFVRPYTYVVVRTDDNRLKQFDDHPKGRKMSGGLHTRHNAIGRRTVLSRRFPDATYEIIAEENSSCESIQTA